MFTTFVELPKAFFKVGALSLSHSQVLYSGVF